MASCYTQNRWPGSSLLSYWMVSTRVSGCPLKHKTHLWLRVLVLVCLSACNWIPTERPVTQPSLLSSLFSKISSERLTLSSLWGEGLVRELGIYTYPLLYLKWITNKVHHIAQGTLFNVMWQPGWEGNLGENGNMYVYSWVTLLSTWNYHNIVNWPYSDIKYKNEKKKKKAHPVHPETPFSYHSHSSYQVLLFIAQVDVWYHLYVHCLSPALECKSFFNF